VASGPDCEGDRLPRPRLRLRCCHLPLWAHAESGEHRQLREAQAGAEADRELQDAGSQYQAPAGAGGLWPWRERRQLRPLVGLWLGHEGSRKQEATPVIKTPSAMPEVAEYKKSSQREMQNISITRRAGLGVPLKVRGQPAAMPVPRPREAVQQCRGG
jgi:hypothetical protein